MYDYDDFYSEPSEFEQQIEEFKASLIGSVKDKYKEEMERLRKENEELQSVKNDWLNIQKEYKDKNRQIVTDKENFERKLKKMRITELLGENLLTGWFPASQRIEKPKCDKCDEGRRIYYEKPSGKRDYETCQCGEPTYFYQPQEIQCIEFYQSKSTWNSEYPRMSLYFQRKEDKDYDAFERCRNPYNGEPFEDLQSYRIVFFKQEDCQRYCDWKNAK